MKKGKAPTRTTRDFIALVVGVAIVVVILYWIGSSLSEILRIKKGSLSNGNGFIKETPKVMHSTGYIRSIVSNENEKVINFDNVEFIEGLEKIIESKVEDGVCANKNYCYTPSGFYIRNFDQTPKEFSLSDDLKIIMQTYSHTDDGNFNWNEKISLKLLENTFKTGSYLKDAIYDIEITEGLITQIKQRYIP